MIPGARPSSEVATDFCSAAELSLRDLQVRIGLEGWWVLRRNDDEHVVLAAVDSVFGQPVGAIVSWEDSFCRLTVEQGAPSVAADIDEVACYAEARTRNGLEARALIVVPLTAPGGRVIGILRALGTSVRPDLPEHLGTVKAAAAVLGVLLSHELDLAGASARAVRAEDAASVDALTGIGNRRAWDAALAQEEARCARHADQAAVVVMDLDGLKALNDTEGHRAGDDALTRTASILSERVRTSDVIARLGGDEFGILLPSIDVASAWTLARDLQRHLRWAGISVSVGVAGRSSRSGLVTAWQQADVAMYAEKSVHRQRDALTAGARPAVPPSTGDPAIPAPRLALPAPMLRVPRIDRRGAEPAWTSGPLPSAHSNLRALPSLPSSQSPSRARLQCAGPAPALPRDVQFGTVAWLLDLLRRQLGAQTAYAALFTGERLQLRHMVSDTPVPVQVGSDSALQTSLSWLIATDAVPAVCADVEADPHLRTLAATIDPVVGSYAALALRGPTGEPYGTFGVFSQHPDPALGSRDVDVLRAVAGPLGVLLSSEAADHRAHHRVIERLDRLSGTGGLVMHFQPVVDLRRHQVVGAEALARFPGADLRPDEWFAMAASVGASTALELQAVAGALGAQQDPRLPGFLAVNLSPEAACSPGFRRLLSGRALERLIVEITEHQEVGDYAQLHEALAPLRARGLRLAVDDTGAGYASMRHVLALEPDIIKLDISLVREVHTDPRRRALAAALTGFARTIGAKVIAEGIETVHELSCLADIGVHYGQGYYLGRPAPLPDAE